MTFSAELDDARVQLRRGYAGNILTSWPKFGGVNALVTAPSASWSRPDGTGLGALVVTATAVNGASRLRVTLDASAQLLGEDYRVDWLFTFDGLEHSRSTRVDVVTQPFAASDELSLNDLRDVWADVEPMLRRQAIAQQEDRTAEQQAGLIFQRAWTLIHARLRKLVEASYPSQSMPALITSRAEIKPIVVAQAIALAWLGDNNSAKAAEWEERAAKYFAEMPALRFDVNQDLVPDSTIKSWCSSTVGRSW